MKYADDGLLNHTRDVVFKQAPMQAVQKIVFQSLATDCIVCPTMIDIWAMIMNEKEQFRDMSQPNRLFCTIIMICHLISNYVDLYSRSLLI